MNMPAVPEAKKPFGRQMGFTLIEVLVGIVIGLIALLAIFQTISVWEARTRASTAGGDAQIAGTLAMFNLERDIRQAGQGFGTAPPSDMNCLVDASVAGTPTQFQLAPVEIVDNTLLGIPDEIRVLYGSSAFFASRESYSTSTLTTKHTKRRDGFRPGDVAVVTSGSLGLPGSSVCSLVQITADSDPDGVTLAHDTVAYADFYKGANQVSKYNNAAGTPGYTSGNLYSMGPGPRRNVWRIAAGAFGFVDSLQPNAAPFEVADQVIDVKAMYGLDGDGDTMISDLEWTKALPPSPDFTRILAIRVALLVRSRNYEKPGAASVTTVAPTWGPAATPFVMTNVSGGPDGHASGDPSTDNWRNYRYRVFEKAIPLRNVIWGSLGGPPILP
jgi:type IV pilus assembly protein PilW